MLDIKFIRQNQDKVREAIKNKNVDLDLDKLLATDERRRHLLNESESLKAEQNKRSKGPQSPVDLEELKALKEKIKLIENELACVKEDFEKLMSQVPNIPSEDTPVGKDESENKVLRKWGKIKNFDFKPKEHWELGADLDLIDSERAAKVSGTRFGYLKKEAALLEMALLNFGLKTLVEKGFTPSDGSFNLGFALAQTEVLQAGIYVAIQRKVFQPEEVIKLISEGRFISIFNK